MKKCLLCGSELSPQTRFCNICGAQQPFETLTPLIPPPPPPPPSSPLWSEEEKKSEDDSPTWLLPESWEDKPDGGSLTGQLGQQPRGEHLQPQQLRGEHLQPQQLRGEHLQPEGVHKLHQQPGKSRYYQRLEDERQQYPHTAEPQEPHYLRAVRQGFNSQSKTLMITVSSLVIVSIMAAIVLTMRSQLPQGLAVNRASIIGSGNQVPGGLVTIHGSQFTSGGTWQGQGQGTCFNASCQFDMTLTVANSNGNSFSGTLRENVYNTTVNISGTINGDTISFTGTSYVSGNQIQLGCIYSGTVSNGKITGNWVYPNPTDGGGTLSLSLTS